MSMTTISGGFHSGHILQATFETGLTMDKQEEAMKP